MLMASLVFFFFLSAKKNLIDMVKLQPQIIIIIIIFLFNFFLILGNRVTRPCWDLEEMMI